jgi:hypothetical protein
LKHLKKFAKNGASFKDIDKNWLEDFKTTSSMKPRAKPINTFRKTPIFLFQQGNSSIERSVKEGIIQTNPANQVEGIKADDPDRAHLGRTTGSR